MDGGKLKYLKNIAFWNINKEINTYITEGLTILQKQKYRKQYIKLAYNTFILSAVYILTVVGLIGLLFDQKALWAIGLIILILRDYETLTLQLQKESELIYERIEKRKKKNIKQGV